MVQYRSEVIRIRPSILLHSTVLISAVKDCRMIFFNTMSHCRMMSIWRIKRNTGVPSLITHSTHKHSPVWTNQYQNIHTVSEGWEWTECYSSGGCSVGWMFKKIHHWSKMSPLAVVRRVNRVLRRIDYSCLKMPARVQVVEGRVRLWWSFTWLGRSTPSSSSSGSHSCSMSPE